MSRLAARRAAVQMVYEKILGGAGGDDTLLGLIAFSAEQAEDDVYIQSMLAGIEAHAEELDGEIQKRSQSRELNRIPVVSRSILRTALYELKYLQDTPPAVVVNEAVELAKRFAEEADARFINGILGNYLREGDTR